LAVREVDRPEVSEPVGTVIVVQPRIVFGAVQAKPAAAGGGYALCCVLEESTPDVVAGAVAVDDEAADVAGVVRRVVPQLGVGS
jgi:hypothetical protein